MWEAGDGLAFLVWEVCTEGAVCDPHDVAQQSTTLTR